MKLAMEMGVVPKIIDLLHKCPYPGYRRCTYKFLTKWAKFVASQVMTQIDITLGLIEMMM